MQFNFPKVVDGLLDRTYIIIYICNIFTKGQSGIVLSFIVIRVAFVRSVDIVAGCCI